MAPPFRVPTGSQVTKLALKRAEVGDLVMADEALRAAPFIKALGAKHQDLLLHGTARRYPHNAVLFQQGDSGASLFFVLKGEVRLSARKGPDSVELGTATRGEVFGEAEILSGETLRTSFAVAQTDVDAAEFPREAFLESGRLLHELATFLGPIKAARQTALLEMTDFLNRW